MKSRSEAHPAASDAVAQTLLTYDLLQFWIVKDSDGLED